MRKANAYKCDPIHKSARLSENSKVDFDKSWRRRSVGTCKELSLSLTMHHRGIMPKGFFSDTVSVRGRELKGESLSTYQLERMWRKRPQPTLRFQSTWACEEQDEQNSVRLVGVLDGILIYDITYDTIWYILIATELTPGGSSTVHIYTQTIHRTTQSKQNIQNIPNKNT
jgi:hypothetical protein